MRVYEVTWTEPRTGDDWHWTRFIARDWHDAIVNVHQSIDCRPEIRIVNLVYLPNATPESLRFVKQQLPA
jgi:hypothetical protein